MAFTPTRAEIRFGCGLSPEQPPPASLAEILQRLNAPDVIAARFPIEPFEVFRTRMVARHALQRELRAHRGSAQGKAAQKQIRLLKRAAREDHLHWMGAHLARCTWTGSGFRERLESFWADHFTATGKAGIITRGASPYRESAIRPHLTGRFEDLLVEAVTHPLMVHYLDQDSSVGPNSARGLKVPGKAGVNENLAREILELHTLGADGPYTQTDVSQLAELLTGLTMTMKNGRVFRKDRAEPGAETVLGHSYGGSANPHLRDIRAVLADLAHHPATARHMARKLAVHFVSDTPDPALIAAVEAAWIDSGGALLAVYEALLRHPAAWQDTRPNAKLPFEFVASACRALAVPGETLISQDERDFRRRIHAPLRLMGHIWQKPTGPDGLDEADSAWITPQGIAARLQWAVAVPSLLLPTLPDPRDFVHTALGDTAPEAVLFAARAAESRADGVGLVLASPAFQRM